MVFYMHVCVENKVTCSVNSFVSFQMPKMEIRSNARPSLYGYVPHLEKEKGKEREKVCVLWTIQYMGCISIIVGKFIKGTMLN